MSWIDTHCHLDAAEFGDQSVNEADAAFAAGVEWIVLPAVAPENFATVRTLAHATANGAYALGIHPLFTPDLPEGALTVLRAHIEANLSDPRFVALGEIGLDYFVPALCTPAAAEKQEYFFAEQLKLAREFELPVLLHVRRSQDRVLKYVRRMKGPTGHIGGIAHAFNGSFQQAQAFIEQGFVLGFGGAMTFTRALQIRRLAVELPLSALVLETDAPDMSPAWRHPHVNRPFEVVQIGKELAALRQLTPADIAAASTANALRALPRLAALQHHRQRV